MIKKTLKTCLFTFTFVGFCCAEVFAMTAPGGSAKFKAISDFIVDDVAKGPIGYSAAVVSAGFSATMLIMSKVWPFVGGLIGTGVFAFADKIVESTGAVII